MEIGNEKQNKATHQSAGLGSKQQEQWRAVCGADQRFYFVNLDTKVSQWLPPTELWSSKFGLPYGWEAGLSKNNLKYYINHVNKISTLEDPRSEADQVSTHLQMAATRARKIQIKRDPSLGFGFVAGSEKPVVIRSVISGGPSHGKLFSNDQILKVNGKDVSEVAQERVISLIKACSDELEVHVVSSEDLQDAKNQGQRRSSLMSRATRERRRSSPVNVRFADDMVQYIGPAEQARRGSLPVLPNVLKVYLENGQTRSFHYDPKTTVEEIFNALGPKLDIKAMEYFCLVLSGPRKNQLSFLQNHEKVSEIYLNRNCSRSSWVCKLRICFIPGDPSELLERDPVAFDYLYDQLSKDIVEGLFEIDLRYDLAIKLAALHMQQKATEAKNKMPAKISVKSVEKDFDGLENFLPENIINGVKLKDLRKVLDQQIKFNQSLASLGQRYLTSKECKQQYLKLASELVSYGGKYFHVILYSYDGTGSTKARQQEATVLVSPKYGLSQVVKGKINVVLCQLAELEQISGFSISFHAEGKRLLTISVNDNKDLVLLMKPLDSMDLVTFIVGYQKLWNCTTGKLTVKGERKEPLAPLNDHDIPPYASLHRVIPDTWSYPSFLQVPGNNSDHHFYLDLSKDPPKYAPSDAEPTSGAVGDVQTNQISAKRSSGDINTSESGEEGVSSESVSGKRFKADNSRSSDEEEDYIDFNSVEDVDMTESPSKTRTLYSIAEESQNSNAEEEEEEPVEDDYISQLALAEEIWRKNRNEKIEISLDDSSFHNERESQDIGSTEDDNQEEEFDQSMENDKNGEENRLMDSDDNDDDDDDSEEEIEVFQMEKNSSDQEEFKHNDKAEREDINKIEEQQEEQTTKKDNVKLDELKQGKSDELLDINDIDFDDHTGISTSDPLDLLADFSFTGEINPQRNESLEDKDRFLQHDDDDDDDHDDEDTLDLPKSEAEANNPLNLSTNVDRIDASDDSVLTPDNKPEDKRTELEKSNEVDKSIIVETFDTLASEKVKDLDKKENLGDSGDSDFDGKTLDYKIQNATPIKDNQKCLDENDADEVGIQLLSYKQRKDQDNVKPEEVSDFDEERSGDNSMDGDNHLERKDSDSSSLSSQGSRRVVNALDSAGVSHEEDPKAFAEEERNQTSNLKAESSSFSSSDEVDSIDEVDTKMESKDLLGRAKQNRTEENRILDAQNYLKEEKPESHEPARTDQDDDEGDIATEHGKANHEGSKMDKNATGVTTNNLENVETKPSSSMVLFIGNDPGESEDALESYNDKDSSEKNSDNILKKSEVDFQDFSLMDWIIPPPPGSTEELLESDISVASPPPSSPGFESISSPPVELNENVLNEFQIDGMILPPPPMGSSFSSVIRIVSPPPIRVRGSNRQEKPPAKRDVKTLTTIESNRQQLDRLTLEDSRNVTGEEFMPVNLAQSRSSESSGSIMTDDYNSGSISCYSLSNDSQRTSEDEFFDEERNEVFGETEDQSIENVALFHLLEQGPTTMEEEEDININDIRQERTKKLNNKPANDEIGVAGQEEDSQNNGLKTIKHVSLKENSVLNLLSNGLPYEDDYDCLDEVPFTVEYDASLSESINTSINKKSRLPDLSQERTVLLPTRKKDQEFLEKIDGPMRSTTTFDNYNLGQVMAEKSISEEGYVKNRANWLDRREKPDETNTMKNLYSPKFSPKMKENGTKQKEILNESKVDKAVLPSIRTLNERNPKTSLNHPWISVSHKEKVPNKQNTPKNSILPDYLLKDTNTKPSGEAGMNLPSSDWSLEFESEAATDEDQSPRFQRKAPAKRGMNGKTHTQNHKDMVYADGMTGEGISSDESGKMDGAGASCKDVSENNGEISLNDESSICLSARDETLDLTERLKLRLQGCVDDCQNAVLKPSYLPYATSTKWKEGVHDNAVFLASDIKLLHKNVQEMNSDVVPSIKASQETLQSLVSSFVLASTSQQRISLYSVRMLAGILNDVISLYNEVIIKVEEAVRFHPNKSKLKSVTERTTSMTALIASLRRTLKRL